MADLTLRLTKGFPITFEEMDSNLLALDSDSPWHVAKSFITYPNPVGIGPGALSPTYNIDFGGGDSFNVATIGTADAALQIHVDGPHPFEIFTNSQERFTVTTAGLVGINVPNPAQPLDVDGIIQTTTTFIGNQAYCNSFYDGNMTISAGSIFNAENGNFSGRIRFGELRDDSGVVISRFATEVTPTDEKLPTSNAVVNYVTNAIDSSTSELNALLDSEHAWNVAEHSALSSRIDSEHAWNVAEHSALDSALDSEHAWNIAEHQLLSDSLTSEIIARKDADSNLGVRIDNITSDFDSALDSEHAWNVAEHQLLSDSLTAEIIARKNADSDLGVRIDDETQERKDADSDLGVRIDDLDSALDSEHAWNVAEHQLLSDSLTAEIIARQNADSDLGSRIDSEHAWNVAEHNALKDADSDINARIDSDYSWNVAEHNALKDADSDINARIDSEHAWNVVEHNELDLSILAEILARSNADSDINARIDSEHAWNVAEHLELSNANSDLSVAVDSNFEYFTNITNQLEININNLDSRLDSELVVIDGKLDSLSGSISNEINVEIENIQNNIDSIEDRLDSEHAWNIVEHNILQSQFDNLTTDSVTEGLNNLYYTDGRVDSYINVAVDSNFLDNRMPLGNLSDVQINTPTLENDDVLQWNGTVWSNQSIGIVGTIQFRGGVDATTENAPSVKENGDFYVNVASGTALGTWTGLTQVDSGDALVWDSDGDTWGNLGKITQGSVVKVRPGTAISVDETDPARPTVSVDKTITDTWYYTQSQIDTITDSEHDWNVAEHVKLDDKIDEEALARATEDAIINGRLDSEHAWNVAEHSELQSNLDSELAIIDDKLDSLSLSLGGEINVEINQIQDQLDSVEDRLDSEHAWNVAEHLSLTNKIDSAIDSEHAWNVAEHLELSNANSDLSSAIDSNFEYFTNITNQLEININNLDSRLDSELAVIDDKLDSLSLSIGGEINVEINQIQDKLDSVEDRIDSEHAWNVAEHLALSNRIDSEHAWNVQEHGELQSSIDSVYTNLTININNLDSRLDSELSIIDDKLDSLSLSIGGEINVEINQIQDKLDNLTTDSVAEGTTNLYYTDARVTALVDSAYVQERVTFPEFDSNSVIELVDSDFVNSLVDFPDTQVLDNTDSLPEGLVNLYYTDARVTALVDSAYVQSRVEFPEFDSNSVIELVDSDFVNSLVDFPDTQVLSTTDSLPEGINNLYYTDSRVENKILSTVDSDYVMERVSIESNLRFKGATSVDVYNAPIDPENGDIYINDSEAVANNTWVGIAGETIAEAQSLGWAEDEGRWYALGGLHDREIHDSDFVQSRQQYVTIDSDAPSNPYDGEMWLDRNSDTVKLYDGTYWFEFPAGGTGGSTLVIDSDVPSAADEGDLWLDKTDDVVKIYDGSVWFEFPTSGGSGGFSEQEIIAMIDSALQTGTISLDASPTGGASDDF